MYLPLAATGKEALEPFGYSLFEGVPVTFAPATDVRPIRDTLERYFIEKTDGVMG